MDLGNAWTVATKDFAVFRRKKSVIYSIILFPLLVSILLPLVLQFAGAKSGGIPAAVLPTLLNAFAFFFIIGAATLPTAIASYSLVGEKVEKSLEPLLATPTTDGSEEAMLKAGAFAESEIASAMRLVFPVLEKKRTHVRIILGIDFSLYMIFVDTDVLNDRPFRMNCVLFFGLVRHSCTSP